MRVRSFDSPVLGLRFLTFHVSGPSDEIDEHPEERQEENEDGPGGFGQTAMVSATEVIDERPKNRENHKEEQRGQDQGPKYAEQWVVISEHGFS
jgi:hypothetical protein